MKKLKNFKENFKLQMERLSEKELSFLTGGLESTLGSSGTSSGSSATSCTCCDNTSVHCCPPKIKGIGK